MSKNRIQKISPSGIESVSLKRLKDSLVKDNITIADMTIEDILKKYKTFQKSIDNGTRTKNEVEEMISVYLGVPVDILRVKKNNPFDVPEDYKGVVRGYVRVSSSRNSEKQDTERQIRELKEQGVEVFYEDYASGTRDDRIDYNRMLREAKTQDVIICTEISRLSRSSLNLIQLLEFIRENKMCLKCGALLFDCRENTIDPITKGMVQMMSVFANIERDLISQRTKSGLENAVANGKKLGRPEISIEELPQSFVDNYHYYRDSKKYGKKLSLETLSGMCRCGNRKTIGKYVQMAKSFEEENGELLENFRTRIKDDKEFAKWQAEQIFKAEEMGIIEIPKNEDDDTQLEA